MARTLARSETGGGEQEGFYGRATKGWRGTHWLASWYQ